ERLVVLGCVDADHEIRSVELPNQSPALTERVALGRSTTGEGFRKPPQHDPVPSEILEAVGLAIGARKREVRSRVADLELSARVLGSGRTGEQTARDERERQQP